jgi:hypothetical protein
MTYHPEYFEHFPPSNLAGEYCLDLGGNNCGAATRYAMDWQMNGFNCRRGIVGVHEAGYLCRDLRCGVEWRTHPSLERRASIPARVSLRVRLRLAVTTDPAHEVDVLRVQVLEKTSNTVLLDRIVGSGDSSCIPATGFPAQRLGATNSYGEVTIGAFTLEDASAIDIQVYWPGTASVYLDYIALDDAQKREVR